MPRLRRAPPEAFWAPLRFSTDLMPWGRFRFPQGIAPGIFTNSTATLSVSNLAAGTHSISASYSGGGFHGASTSSALQQVVNGNMNLAIATGGSKSAIVMAGGTAQYSLTIGGSGFSGQTSMTCTGAPTGATCSLNPSNPMVSAAIPTLLNVSVSTTARTSGSLSRLSRVSPGWGLSFSLDSSLCHAALVRPGSNCSSFWCSLCRSPCHPAGETERKQSDRHTRGHLSHFGSSRVWLRQGLHFIAARDQIVR